MRSKLLLSFVIPVLLAGCCQGQYQFQVLHNFGAGTDGAGLWSSVAFDPAGNLYGTTSGGGAYGYGTVYELTPGSNGEWSESVLYDFPNPFTTGEPGIPWGGLVLDVAGNLYGTTQLGGAYHAGAVFELTPGSGGWTYAVIHNFGGPGDPTCCPWGNPIIDRRGDLYGTGYSVFKLSPGPDGWSENILHVFSGENGDGYFPQAGPIMDSTGNLYGTTADGGGSPNCPNYGCGTVYELQPVAVGAWALGITAWRERILHRFGAAGDGAGPSLGQLAIDRFGNLYGATEVGGWYGYGTVFGLTRAGGYATGPGVTRAETILHNFRNDTNGSFPGGGVILDAAGNLYGTTIDGGSPLCSCGVVYKLSRQGGGAWQYTLLHTFEGSDGDSPDANLTIGPDGNLYGTTATGGEYTWGVVFQIQIAP